MGIQPYPITSPSDAALPFVIWNFVAGEEEFDLSGPSGFREETYTFTIVARTYDEVVDIREDLRTLLQNSSPLTFVNTGESPTFDSAEYPSLYVQSVLYTGLLPTTTIVSPQVLSASYAQTCSFLTGTIESASYAVKSKTAETASYMAGAIESASYAATAAFALNVPATASHALVADIATTASYALNTPTLPDGLVSSSAQVLNGTGIVSGSTIETASYALTASYAPTKDGVVSSSTQFKSSDPFTIGALSAASIYTPSTLNVGGLSQLYKLELLPSGSTPTTEKMTIDVGSLRMGNGNLIVTGSVKVAGKFVGNLLGTATYALQANTASYAPLPSGVVSSSAQVLEGSNVFSSSAQLPTGIVSGSTQIADWSVLSSSYALSSSHAVSASWAPQPTVPETSSYALQALSASWAPAQPAVSASYAATSSTWNGYGVWVGTRTEYNTASGSGLDPKTLYFIKE